MSISVVPEWMAELDEEDVAFIAAFFWPPVPSRRWRESTG